MTTTSPAPQPDATVVRRTIDHIPEDERHGKGRDLFTVWFGSNIMLLTIITGALSTTVFGLPLWAGVIGVLIGNIVGGVVMALHAAQGPQMGVPQMLQTRAQFGSYGSLLVVVLVVFMYLGFFASNAVLGGKALAKVSGMPVNLSTFLIGCVSVVATMVGYKLIHGLAAFLSVVAGGDAQPLPNRQAGVLSDGERVELEAGPDGCGVLLITARPLGEPVVQYGPFVMNTREEIEQALDDYRAGTLA